MSRSLTSTFMATLILVATPLASTAQPAITVPEIASKVSDDSTYPQPAVAFPAGVKGLPGVAYTSTTGFRPATLDLYLPPASAKGPYPFIVYVHGGGWAAGNERSTAVYANWPNALASLAARGYVVASVNYRMSGEVSYTGMIDDIRDSLRWLRGQAGKYNIDKQRGAVWGASAGGHLASLTALTCGIPTLDKGSSKGAFHDNAVESNVPRPPVTESDCVKGAAIWFGPADLVNMKKPAPAMEKLLNDMLKCTSVSSCAAAKKAASPVTYVNKKSPTMLLIHGTDDHLVSVSDSRLMHELLRKNGVPAELVTLDGIDHSFVGKTPAQTRQAATQAWEKTVQFFDKVLAK